MQVYFFNKLPSHADTNQSRNTDAQKYPEREYAESLPKQQQKAQRWRAPSDLAPCSLERPASGSHVVLLGAETLSRGHLTALVGQSVRRADQEIRNPSGRHRDVGWGGLTVGVTEAMRRPGSGDGLPGRRRRDAGAATASRREDLRERRKLRGSRAVATGNPPGLTSRGFLPRGKRREAGCDPRMGGLPKCAKIWPGGDWHGGDSPGKTRGSPRGNGLPK